MNQLYYEYAKKLSDLGDRIINISDQFPLSLKLDTAEKIKNQYDISLKAITEYKEVKLAFLLVVVPDIVQKEHKEVISALQMFINGTEYMFKSIDVNNSHVDKDMISKGLSLQEQGKDRIVQLADQICKKFGV